MAESPDSFSGAMDAYRRGDLAAAEVACGAALDAQPDRLEALDLRGLIRFGGGRPAEALVDFEAAAGAAPGRAISWVRLGAAQGALGRHGDALASFDRAIAIDAADPGVWINRGVALAALGRPDAALDSHDRALALAPDAPEGLLNRAKALAALDRPEAALATLDHLIGLKLIPAPTLAQAHDARGILLARLGRREIAIEAHRQAVTLAPAAPELHHNLGLALSQLRRDEAALAAYDRALALNPTSPDLWASRGKALYDLTRNEDAVAACARALALRPDHAEALSVAGMARLAQGALALGWAGYEHRWRTRDGPTPRHADHPRWTGEPVAGARLLLHAEQGYGDTIQFVRYAELARRRGARVLLEVPPRLKALAAMGLDPPAEVFARGDPLPAFDLQCPLMSLPFALGTTLETIPWSGPYLRADPALTAVWRDRLGEARRPRVGLAWSGNPEHNNDLNRSLPLAAFAGLVDLDLQWICLQKALGPADRALLERTPGFELFWRETSDFADAAALTQACDLVISVDTALAHLAGALGKPLWILLSHAADWRWMRQRPDTPWYPQARLLRQTRTGEWDPVLASLRADLRRRFGAA
jgi:tetratricopeptide (TPR) repeat protein